MRFLPKLRNPRATALVVSRRGDPAGSFGWRRCCKRKVAAQANDEEADFDISVFQFTLGIPGIPDEQVPRILGCLSMVLLGLNHISSDVIDGAQIRSEAVGLFLGATCIALPSLNNVINFSNSSILSQSERTVPNTKEVFFLAEDREEETRRELAWNSFALLKNTNSSFVLFAKDGELMLARGSFKIPGLPQGIPVTDNYPLNKVLSTSFKVTGSCEVLEKLEGKQKEEIGTGTGTGTTTSLYLENEAMIERLNLYADLCFLAKGIKSLFISKSKSTSSSSGSSGVIIVGANAPKAFSQAQQQWVVNIGKKLSAV